MQDINNVENELTNIARSSNTPSDVLKSSQLKGLYKLIAETPAEDRRAFGQAVNDIKLRLEKVIAEREAQINSALVIPIDVTAPMSLNHSEPSLLPANGGTLHPLMSELAVVIDIFTRMGFEAIESRQIDDDFNMFGALNFPENHPARDGYDTFRTEEGFSPPAHTSTMQHRILKNGKQKLERGENIAAISYGRVFRNEDVDATHEHTFYQVEGVFVSKNATLANMLAVLRLFFETYYKQSLKIKTQPSYFPFVEPGLEFAIEKPQSLGGKSGEWLEMLGCGMIHPNVLKMAGIDPDEYKGFAWGGGVERLVMLKYGIEDLRHFESGRLKFLRKFVS